MILDRLEGLPTARLEQVNCDPITIHVEYVGEDEETRRAQDAAFEAEEAERERKAPPAPLPPLGGDLPPDSVGWGVLHK